MNIKYLSILILTLVLLFGCDLCNSNNKDSIFNTWVKFDDEWASPLVLQRADKLNTNNYGFSIISNGKFIERKNSGWCGTPPIAYKNYNGKWKYVSEDIIEIEVEFWGGVETYKIEILSINKNEIMINYIYDYEE